MRSLRHAPCRIPRPHDRQLRGLVVLRRGAFPDQLSYIGGFSECARAAFRAPHTCLRREVLNGRRSIFSSMDGLASARAPAADTTGVQAN